MRKKFLVLFFAISSFCFSQYNQWVWVKGDTVANTTGSYGAKGVAANSNLPSARSWTGQWTDNIGNFWLFGGGRVGLNESRNDLWKYTLATNQWTWMKGSDTANSPGSIGVQGVAAATNEPPNRIAGFCTWVDNTGNLWLFGGNGIINGSGCMKNDLWKYDISTGWWTWMRGTPSGFSSGSYGAKGVASNSNEPPARDETSCSWTDNNGKLWFFGGRVWPTAGWANDLWKYDPVTNQWTWMSGSNTIMSTGFYGTKGVSTASTVPSAREAYTNWKDSQGNLWLYGGYGPNGLNNDLWKYDVVTNQWTWVWGDSAAAYGAVYNTGCISSVQNTPGERRYCNSEWVDDCDNFYLFGGWTQFGPRGDLWRYNMSTNDWTWISGDSVAQSLPIYNTVGVPSVTNNPGMRYASSSWRNKDGLWFFGGQDWAGAFNNGVNDLWKYIPDTSIAGFTQDITTGCAPQLISFTNTSTPGCNEIKSYVWNFDDPASGSNNSSTSFNPAHQYNGNGVFDVTLSLTNCIGIKSSQTQTINLSGPTVDAGTNVTIAYGSSISLSALSANANSYTWTPGNALSCTSCSVAIASPETTTKYFVVVSDNSGCTATDSVIVTVDFICGDVFMPTVFSPNGDGNNDFYLPFGKCIKGGYLKIFNRWGEKIAEVSDVKTGWDGKDNSGIFYNSGIYVYSVYVELADGTTYNKSGNFALVR